MQRKNFSYKLNDGEYSFAERNKEDVDFGAIIDRLRKYWFKFIQENTPDKDERLTLMMHVINTNFSETDISFFVNSNKDEQKRFVFDSFKVMNDGISFEKFKEILPEGSLQELISLVTKIEELPKKKTPPASR